MTRRLWVVLAVFSVLAPDSAHAQSQKAHAGSDTLPATVAKRSLEAYNRHDLTALQSYYDTVFTHELLGDSAAKYTGTPPQMFAGMSDYFAKNKVRAVLKQQIVSGRYVVQLYDFIENGKRAPHIEVYEIRHGKIVHDWDQGPDNVTNSAPVKQ